MIIGKPITTGGSGGLTPIINVNSITGSTVTCDGIQGTEVSGTWTFKVSIGTHTIVGQYDGKTQTKTVVVDAVGQYEVEIDYKLWLYNLGDECEDVTGGWNITKSYQSSSSQPTMTKNSDNLFWSNNNSTHWKSGWFGTNNIVDVSSFTKLCMDVNFYTNVSNYTNAVIGLCESLADVGGSPNFVVSQAISTSSRAIVICDIENVYQNLYIALRGYNGNSVCVDATATFYKVWLE